MNKHQIEIIELTKNFLIEKHGQAFLRLSKEKQAALICEMIQKAIEHKTRGV